jgi:hypothetical protein
MGSNYNLTRGLFDSTRTLATHVYLIIAEGISSDRAFASAAVLVFLLLAVNGAARWLIGRVGRMARSLSLQINHDWIVRVGNGGVLVFVYGRHARRMLK